MQARVTSVEADLFLDGAAIRVAHNRGQWRGDFETLYLKPLNQLCVANSLPIRAGETFLLWLDLKEGSAALDSWYRKYAAKEMNEVRFCLAFVHDPGTFHTTKAKPG